MTLRFTPPPGVSSVRLPTSASSLSKPLNLGFLSPHNPYDRRAFSGTAFFAARALSRLPGVRLRVLGPHRPRKSADRLRERLFGGQFSKVDPDTLDLSGLDAVIGLVASELLDRLRPRLRVPYFHVTDATPGFLREAYDWNVPPEADAVERRVAMGAAAVLYSSGFMVQRAYAELGQGIAAQGVHFGINLEALPTARPHKSPPAPLHLLFVGTDWERKGGNIALATLAGLRAQGVKAKLTIVGHPHCHLHGTDGLSFTGFLDKNRPRDAARLADLYTQAHLLLLPSRGDCTPMVLAEAMAHGTPVLASDTGGIPELVNKKAGGVLPKDAEPEQWVKSVRNLTHDVDAYMAMSEATFSHAHRNFTWGAWANAVEIIVDRQRETLMFQSIA